MMHWHAIPISFHCIDTDRVTHSCLHLFQKFNPTEFFEDVLIEREYDFATITLILEVALL